MPPVTASKKENSFTDATQTMISASSNGKKDTPSLVRRAKPENKEEPTIQDKRTGQFDQNLVAKYWSTFGEDRLTLGAGDAEKLVLSRKLKKSSDHELEIELGSRLEMTILEKFEQDLVKFFRDKLENDHIVLKKSIQVHEEAQKLYTSQDKFEFMIKENPALKTLRDKLGLDFEY